MDVEREVSYVDKFGTHAEWNDLHDGREWQPPDNKDLQRSENVQHAHFCAFFHNREHLCNALPEKMKVVDVMGIVMCGLRSFLLSGIWLRLRRALRVRVFFKSRVVASCLHVRGFRDSVLDEWMQYWQDCEQHAKDELRSRCSSRRLAIAINVRRAGQQALAHALSATPDRMKVEVLWQLYWLLRMQASAAVKAYWCEWFALQAKRKKLLSNPHAISYADFSDAHQPLTLRAVDAALFVKGLQFPRFHAKPGREVMFKELVRLANAPNVPFVPDEENTSEPMHPPTSVTAAFASSPLCSNPKWFLQRCQQQTPLIPPLAWQPLGMLLQEDSEMLFEDDDAPLEDCAEPNSEDSRGSRLLQRRTLPTCANLSLGLIRPSSDALGLPLVAQRTRSSHSRSPGQLRSIAAPRQRSRSPRCSLVEGHALGSDGSHIPLLPRSMSGSPTSIAEEPPSSVSSNASSSSLNAPFPRRLTQGCRPLSGELDTVSFTLSRLRSAETPPDSPCEPLSGRLGSPQPCAFLRKSPRAMGPLPHLVRTPHLNKLEVLRDGTTFIKCMSPHSHGGRTPPAKGSEFPSP
eukprot:GGOE01003172.1.p1 GENE.GGOE01003172.1~~GGOE01003172.1.p1  ORF type:complete len:574 (-),score=81.71 GGOE01003172.1:1309-3030(-)